MFVPLREGLRFLSVGLRSPALPADQIALGLADYAVSVELVE